MRLVCWNVQWCRGLDGEVDPARIAAYLQSVDADLACLQELASLSMNPGRPHPPTFRLHENKEGVAPYCCDFVYVTPDLVPRLRSIRVDAHNRASDHQPVIVELR